MKRCIPFLLLQAWIALSWSCTSSFAQSNRVGANDGQGESKPANQRPLDDLKIEELVEPYIKHGIVNAVSIGVVRRNQQQTWHFGTLTTKTKQAADDQTVYEIGSITKVFTGILLADFVDRGELQLTQTIGSIVPELRKSNPKLADSIQLIHLATHSSGLPRMPDNIDLSDPTNPYGRYDRKRLMEFLSRYQLQRMPGEKVEYSNLGMGLLGDLLSQVAGKDYETLLHERITTPLQLSDTTIRLTSAQRARLAPPHSASRQPDHPWEFDALAGAGAIRSTTVDMLRFVRANLAPEETPIEEALQLAWQQHVPATASSFAMGLGWHIARDGTTRWHNGQTGGYHAAVFVNRGLDSGVVLLCNTATMEVDPLAESIIQRIAGMKVQPREFESAIEVDAKTVARLAGRYQLVPGFVLTVRPEGKKLFVQATGQPELPVFPVSPTEWKYRVVDAKLEFDLPEKGPSRSVTLFQNGVKLVGKRLED